MIGNRALVKAIRIKDNGGGGGGPVIDPALLRLYYDMDDLDLGFGYSESKEVRIGVSTTLGDDIAKKEIRIGVSATLGDDIAKKEIRIGVAVTALTGA